METLAETIDRYCKRCDYNVEFALGYDRQHSCLDTVARFANGETELDLVEYHIKRAGEELWRHIVAANAIATATRQQSMYDLTQELRLVLSRLDDALLDFDDDTPPTIEKTRGELNGIFG